MSAMSYVSKSPKTTDDQKTAAKEAIRETEGVRYLRDTFTTLAGRLGERYYSVDMEERLFRKDIDESKYTIGDVRTFLGKTEDSEFRKLGAFAAAAINKHIRDGDIVELGIKDWLVGLGTNLKTGKLVINGQGGDALGARMEGGEIVVYGVVGQGAGACMRGGKITINGKPATDYSTIHGTYSTTYGLGEDMEGGEIVLNGNAYYGVGRGMTGGEITINGNAHDVSGLKGGKVTVTGDADYSVGGVMEAGLVVIGGNVKDMTGNGMHGGKVIIKGNAGDETGWLMTGGLIIIEGNAGFETGQDMSGGTIEVKGSIASISRWLKGGQVTSSTSA